MKTIKVSIDDKIINKLGLQAIKEYLRKEIEYLYFKEIAEDIRKKIDQSGIDNDKELEEAREKAWNEYKEKFLKNIIS